MFTFLHAADIHLDSPLKGLEIHEDAPVAAIRSATRMAFENMIDLAIEEDVNFVLIAGDLYDGDWKDYNTGLFFVKQMSRLDKAGIRVFMVSGNHDAASQITRTMPLPDNVTHFPHKKPRSETIEELSVMIHGQSYAARAVTENLARQFPVYDPDYFNIGLLHTSLTGRDGHEDYAPCTADDLTSKGYDYWALGHVHQREVVSEEPWIIFPGNIQGRHIKETGARGVTLVTVADGRISNIDARKTDVLRWAVSRVDLSGCERVDDIYDAVRRALEQEFDAAETKPLAVRMILTGKCGMHAALFDRMPQWIEEFRGIAAGLGDIWLEKVVFDTHRRVSLEAVVGRDTPVAALLESIEKIELDADRLRELVPDLAVLKSKLPPEIQTGTDPFPDGTENFCEIRKDVRELLIASLLRSGGAR